MSTDMYVLLALAFIVYGLTPLMFWDWLPRRTKEPTKTPTQEIGIPDWFKVAIRKAVEKGE